MEPNKHFDLRGLPRPIPIFPKIIFWTKIIFLNSTVVSDFPYDQPFPLPVGILIKYKNWINSL